MHTQHRRPEAGNFRPQYPRSTSPSAVATTGTTRDPQVQLTFDIPITHLPALRSAIEEINNEVGGRLEGAFAFATEADLTDAASALGIVRAGVLKAIRSWNASVTRDRQVPEAAPHYRTR